MGLPEGRLTILPQEIRLARASELYPQDHTMALAFNAVTKLLPPGYAKLYQEVDGTQRVGIVIDQELQPLMMGLSKTPRIKALVAVRDQNIRMPTPADFEGTGWAGIFQNALLLFGLHRQIDEYERIVMGGEGNADRSMSVDGAAAQQIKPETASFWADNRRKVAEALQGRGATPISDDEIHSLIGMVTANYIEPFVPAGYPITLL